ncbi:hypothetical protein BT96DRAFT_950651 [Gymnopus androsaceus JB14]|uniref:Uncharacterized protein n=1 Tax=Gymnopus androsaceus JB14 TaxID=1447944 RepID=A0A6A4GFS1_9AGAR|nr:hypothetical protein BT96DRAFT_950651 [Gymnopus androsaceus JB14]
MVNPSSTSLSSSDAQPRSQRQKDGMRGVPSHTRIPVEDASDSGGYAGCEADERRYVPAEECIPSSSTLHPPGFHESQQSAVTSSPPTSYSAESPQDMLPLADAEVSTEMKAPHRDTISLDSIWAASEESGSSQELRRAIDEREAGWAMEGFLEPLTPNDQPSSYVVSGRAELDDVRSKLEILPASHASSSPSLFSVRKKVSRVIVGRTHEKYGMYNRGYAGEQASSEDNNEHSRSKCVGDFMMQEIMEALDRGHRFIQRHSLIQRRIWITIEKRDLPQSFR